MITPEGLARLLDVAETTLREQILPHLTAEQRYPAAMVANALRIGTRALVEGALLADRHREALRMLYPDDPAADLDALERRLAAELRMGQLAPDREHRVRAVLRTRTLARLALTNPIYPQTYSE